MRFAKVIAKALSAGIHRVVQRCCPRPVGSRRRFQVVSATPLISSLIMSAGLR